MGDEYAMVGYADLFDALRGALTDTPGYPHHNRLAGNLAISVEGVKLAVNRLQRRYQKALCDENTRGLGIDRDIDGEIRQLLRVMRS